ncbi:hypothetical protein R3P38DRAFT_2573475, partial [Favolaschia claudopus]
SSLVLYFDDADVANACTCYSIGERLALEGFLHRVEKYRPRPSQCFKCFRFGHIASQCHSKAVCGTCAGPHPTSECRCPNAKPCKSGKQCPHIVPKMRSAWLWW